LVKIDGYGTVGDELKSALEWEYPKESAYSLPSKVSVTEIKNLEVSKEAKIKVPELAERPKFLMEETKLTGAEIGNLMHLFMQSVKIEKAGSMELLSAQLKEMVERGVYSESESEYVNLEKINNFFRHDLGKRTLTAEKVYREKAFVLRKKLTDSEEEVLVQGIIDCFFVEKDGIVLMDYKTDYVGSFDEKTLLNRYKKQLELYKEAIERITGQKVKETYIYSFSRNKALEVI